MMKILVIISLFAVACTSACATHRPVQVRDEGATDPSDQADAGREKCVKTYIATIANCKTVLNTAKQQCDALYGSSESDAGSPPEYTQCLKTAVQNHSNCVSGAVSIYNNCIALHPEPEEP